MTNNLLQRRAFTGKLQSFVGPARKSGLRSPHGVTGGVEVGSDHGARLDALDTAGPRMDTDTTILDERGVNALAAAIDAAERAFALEVSDYAERVAFVLRGRTAELVARRPEWSRDQIGQQLMAEALALGRDAFARGQNPGAVFVALSDALGFQGTTPASAGSNRVH